MIFRRLRDTGESWALGFWILLPLLGQITAPFYILTAALCRNRVGQFRAPLVAFLGLCTLYTLYIAFVSLRAGDFSSAVEPSGDAASLLITVALATWVLRGRKPIDMQTVYRASVLLLMVVFLLTFTARFGFNIQRPELLMKNPLNLSPVLIMPAMICTFSAFAGSRAWRVAGLVAFFLAAVTLAFVIEARGSTLVLVLLTLMRVGWVLWGGRAETTGAGSRVLIVPLVVTVLAVPLAVGAGLALLDRGPDPSPAVVFPDPTTGSPDALDPTLPDEAVAAVNLTSDASINKRLEMLRAGWRTFLDAPALGHGGQNRFLAAMDYLPPDFGEFSHLHNDFLTHAVAGGLPAVLLLVMILAFPFWTALRHPETSGIKLQLAVLFCGAFGGTAMVNNVLFVDISAFSLGLSYVVALLMIETA